MSAAPTQSPAVRALHTYLASRCVVAWWPLTPPAGRYFQTPSARTQAAGSLAEAGCFSAGAQVTVVLTLSADVGVVRHTVAGGARWRSKSTVVASRGHGHTGRLDR